MGLGPCVLRRTFLLPLSPPPSLPLSLSPSHPYAGSQIFLLNHSFALARFPFWGECPHECSISSFFLLPTAFCQSGPEDLWSETPAKGTRHQCGQFPLSTPGPVRGHSHPRPHFILQPHNVLFIRVHMAQGGEMEETCAWGGDVLKAMWPHLLFVGDSVDSNKG